MSTTYTIIFENNRSQKGNYAVFTQPPIIDSSADVYSNVWMSYTVSVNGNFQINTSVDYYAWVGTAPESPSPGTVVETGDHALVILGTEKQPGTTIPMVVDAGSVSLAADQETRTSQPGSYEIDTGSDFDIPNTRYLIGMGKPDKLGIISPTATILANNNSQTNITPVVKFYIGESSYKAGTIVNFSTATKNAGIIDFTSPEAHGMFSAVVTHQPDGTFDTTYHDSDTLRFILADKAARNKASTPLSDSAKLRQLQTQLQSLYNILEKLGIRGPTPPKMSWSWIARVGWPASVPMTTAATGATMIGLAMIYRGYGCTHTKVTESDGSKSSTFKITRGQTDMLEGPPDIMSDWAAAVAADTQKDQHKNLGVKPVTKAGAGNGKVNGCVHKQEEVACEEWVQ